MERWAPNTKDEHKRMLRIVQRDGQELFQGNSCPSPQKKKNKVSFAKTLRMRKIDLGAHLKQEDKWRIVPTDDRLKAELRS